MAVINETAARLWPAAENPIGARVRLAILEQAAPSLLLDSSREPEVTVIGIVADTRNAGFRRDPAPALMMPYSVVAPPQRLLAVRTLGAPELLLNAVRAQVREMDPEQPLGRPITLEELMGQEVVQPRFTMALFTAFAALGLTLAAAGIYSVLSFHVTRRTHELGVRMALGASRRSVLRLMLSMGGRLVLVGLASACREPCVDAAAAQPAVRHPARRPDRVRGVAVLLGLVALVACYIPARRAASVDPMIALRQE